MLALRACPLPLLAALALTAHAADVPEPRVTAPDLRTASRICAQRGFSYIARPAHAYYCLHTNPDGEPAAALVSQILSPNVRAHSDVIAAVTCAQRGYRYMVRLVPGRPEVLCLESNAASVRGVRNVRELLKEVRQP